MAWPAHHPGQRMTLEEYFALDGEEFRRTELQEGTLVMSPSPADPHQHASYQLTEQLSNQAPAEWKTRQALDVIIDAGMLATVRQPDIVVRRRGTPKRVKAADVVLAVEIISPGSRKIDLGRKVEEYADAGIPHYWVVDLDPPAPSITVFHLGTDGYVEGPAPTGQLITSVPFDLVIDINALLDEDD
ncbi:Uma2 family endonuclease [Fodinicola acaciae]|uniref:Uma2 family endonuclease n=1 Tax=Fodinicola acaciae TaxID=2681555 RepID=UPI0013D5423A|nr:Uma2 family endonuclease [Fodinicola acaciae]